MLTGGVVATFVGADLAGGPPVLALYRPGEDASVDGAGIEMARPVGRSVRRSMAGGSRARVDEVLAELVALPVDADVTPSVGAWSVAAKTAVDLVARAGSGPL